MEWGKSRKVLLKNIPIQVQSRYRLSTDSVEAELQGRGGMGSMCTFTNKDGKVVTVDSIELWAMGVNLGREM